MHIHTLLNSLLHDFYVALYSATSYQKSEDKIRAFLSAITSLPKITHCTDFLGSKICVDEVLKVIKSLHTGKAPGSDGLTAEFYKHFAEDLAPVLMCSTLALRKVFCLCHNV